MIIRFYASNAELFPWLWSVSCGNLIIPLTRVRVQYGDGVEVEQVIINAGRLVPTHKMNSPFGPKDGM